MSHDLELAIHAAKGAGQIIRDAYGKRHTIVSKGANDFATETDIKAEHAIMDFLQQTEYSFLGEETGSTDRKSTKRWVFDPLDGTMNFVRGLPFFAVSIALIGEENDLVLGVVYDPIADECYWAEQGAGAFMNGKQITVNRISDIEKAVFLLDHGRGEEHRREYIRSLHALMLNHGACTLRLGATALMLCYVAKGSFEAFLSCGDELYDYAAGLIIAKEAGASVSDWGGSAWNTASSSLLVANDTMRAIFLMRLVDTNASGV